MKFFLRCFLFLDLFHLGSVHSQENFSSLYLELNIFQHSKRILKLTDGSYWEIKLNNGYFFNDQKTGADWWRFEQVNLRRSGDKEFPYLIENLENHDIVACRQYDPILDHNKVLILSHKSSEFIQEKDLFIVSIIKTRDHLFIQLNDSSYWDIMAIETGWVNTELPQIDDWNRFDKVIFKEGYYLEYPNILFNLNNQKVLFCRQVDPAIPNSVNVRFKASRNND